MRKTYRLIAAALAGPALAVAAGPALAQPDAVQVNNNGLTCFNGYAYTRDGGKYRYTEHHEVKRVNGQITTWNVTYIGRNGQVLARKHMDFTDNPTVPVYTMIMPKTGYAEGIRRRKSQWFMFKRKSNQAETRGKPFTIDQPIAADSGFDPLVKQHFEALNNGKTVKFRFVAAGRESVINLKAQKTGTTRFEGKKAVVFTASLDMFMVNWFVNSLKLTYDPNSERLLEYRGIGNIRNSDGKVYPVRVSYYTHRPNVAKSHGAPAPACGSTSQDTARGGSDTT